MADTQPDTPADQPAPATAPVVLSVAAIAIAAARAVEDDSDHVLDRVHVQALQNIEQGTRAFLEAITGRSVTGPEWSDENEGAPFVIFTIEQTGEAGLVRATGLAYDLDLTPKLLQLVATCTACKARPARVGPGWASLQGLGAILDQPTWADGATCRTCATLAAAAASNAPTEATEAA